jgi:hypothetical protein
MSLDDQIQANAASVKTDSYSMSISELIAMYRDNELELHPEFQRFFRWSIEQKSRLVESLLLGIPIPPVFVSERKDSKWDVIDGLQRLSTILELVGELRKEDGTPYPQLQLTRTHYLPDLEGKKWTDDNPENMLSESTQIRIKRARLDVNIVKSTSDQEVKYEVFQRLNGGGASATDQEIRNCLLVMSNRDYFLWIKKLAEHEGFRNCLLLTDRAIEEAFDMELVIRFLIFVTKEIEELQKIEELGVFLNNESISQAKNTDYDMERFEACFNSVFNFLSENLKGDSFRKYDTQRQRYYGPMLVSLFEVVAIGLGNHLLTGGALPNINAFLEKHKILWQELGQQSFLGSGIRASTRIPQTINFGRVWSAR